MIVKGKKGEKNVASITY